jgi:hypothetical protein
MTNPRTRLARLIDDLELPKGFRLTPAREGCLRQLGLCMLRNGDSDSDMEMYGARVTYRHMARRYALNMSKSEKAALRAMGRAKWIKPREPVAAGYWTTNKVEFQPGLKQLAKRLGARESLWTERRRVHVDAAREPYEAVRNKLYEARHILLRASHNVSMDDSSVLKVYQDLRAHTAECSEAERQLELAQQSVESVPEPTEEEALVWLMQRELSGQNSG